MDNLLLLLQEFRQIFIDPSADTEYKRLPFWFNVK
jgi:hypothetical protein